MTNAAWTVDRVDLLKMLATRDLTAAEIARELGDISRNAVIGKMTRLGLVAPRGKDGAHHHPSTSTRRRLPPVAPISAVQPAVNRPDVPDAAPFVEAEAQDLFGARPRSLLELCAGDCKWPIGDPRRGTFHFCGAAKMDDENIPYCAGHARIAYQPHTRRI